MTCHNFGCLRHGPPKLSSPLLPFTLDPKSLAISRSIEELLMTKTRVFAIIKAVMQESVAALSVMQSGVELQRCFNTSIT